MKQTKFTLSTTKNHVDFTGYVDDHDLPAGVVDALRHKINPDEVEELEVTGEFSVEWDDNQPYVTIESIGIAAGDQYLELDLSDDNFDFDHLVDQIEQDENVNYHEYMAGMEDYYADLAMDK